MHARTDRDARFEFRVRSLDATVDDGIPLVVQGRTVRSGPIAIRLDEAAAASEGVLDYESGTADVTFRLVLDFPAVREALRAAGIEEDEEVPVVRGVLRSTGDILPDHSFSLSGGVTISDHELFRADDLDAGVLPGT
jgi:hypothetical protein